MIDVNCKDRSHLGMVILLIIMVLLLVGCDKGVFLEKKPSSSLVVPTKIAELQGLMDNEFSVYGTPLMGMLSSDEYYLKNKDFEAQNAKSRNTYTWAVNVYDGDSYGVINDWNQLFSQVLIANIVLEGLEAIEPAAAEVDRWRYTKGAAYFLRAKAFFGLAEVFCLPYDAQTADVDLGLPLRLHSDIKRTTPRASLADTYAQIIKDLKQSEELIDFDGVWPNKLRPTKLTVLAMLARVCLSQRKYVEAMDHANNALLRYPNLLDYNGVMVFKLDNPELLSHAITVSGETMLTTSSGVMHVDSILYNSYHANDLRKTLLYKVMPDSRVTLNTTYSTLTYPFTGLATDELYLIRAEGYARKGELALAAKDINTLLVKRYKTGTYTPITFADSESALAAILLERRKELAFRGVRWSDIRRLNKEGYDIRMKRVLDGTIYILPANDLRFALSIPPYEIALSGLEDNPR
ncbi:RagB/SusD family nutrient uptake outer membrane protein [Sphingobacterium sp. SYP-B4668]|uniref:RagB/SusD family nutrient uptake outer membrane protein n=1 Tax=Sphingobacterium sp. SYP-B4668 TaxID=2996035 RepID=UPI0022DE787E|nr:RagB/SusD family nutrient uptake outer membrane protein [Sphingobacterium sp. SYP-B4668]